MLNLVANVGGLGLSKQPKKEIQRASKETSLMDNKQSELQEPPNSPSWIAMYLQSHCDLVAIPPLFFHKLQVLDLSHTNIKALPHSLPNALFALKKLLLRKCKLFMKLSSHVGKLDNLEELDLDETEIISIPIGIGKLVKLRVLKVCIYGQTNFSKRKQLPSNMVLHPGMISKLSCLIELSIDVDPSDKWWHDSVEEVVKGVCNLEGLRSLCLYLPNYQLLDYTSFIYPSLSCFRFTVGHHKRRTISRVPHEVEAQFTKWDKCLKFVNGENIPFQVRKVLKFTSSFFLDRHENAWSLSEFGNENMVKLKFCLLVDCNKMETIIGGAEVETILESLQYLSIHYMKKLTSIWKGPTRSGCMSKLKFLALHTCPKLINIFSNVLLKSFVNLEEIIVEDCPQVTSLVGHISARAMSDAFLPSLKRLFLLYLPELVSISNGQYIAPKLEIIGFYNCPMLKILSKRELSSKTLKKIKGENQWWEGIKWKETDWETVPDYLMHIFSPINIEKDVMTQLVEDRDVFEALTQNEGQQSDTALCTRKLVDNYAQQKGQWADCMVKSVPSPCSPILSSLTRPYLPITPPLNVKHTRRFSKRQLSNLVSYPSHNEQNKSSEKMSLGLGFSSPLVNRRCPAVVSGSRGRQQKLLASGKRENSNDDDKKKSMHRGIGRQRRQEIATLYASLRNLLPPKYIRGKCSISDEVDGAVSYIKYLKKRIDGLSGKRDELKKVWGNSSGFHQGMSMSCIEAFPSSAVVRQSLDGVEIVISDSVGAQALTLSKVLQQLLEEGLDVVNCVSSRTDGALIYTINYEVSDMRGVDPPFLLEKLVSPVSPKMIFE